MVLIATINNISAIYWRIVFVLLAETGVPGQNREPVGIRTQNISDDSRNLRKILISRLNVENKT